MWIHSSHTDLSEWEKYFLFLYFHSGTSPEFIIIKYYCFLTLLLPITHRQVSNHKKKFIVLSNFHYQAIIGSDWVEGARNRRFKAQKKVRGRESMYERGFFMSPFIIFNTILQTTEALNIYQVHPLYDWTNEIISQFFIYKFQELWERHVM